MLHLISSIASYIPPGVVVCLASAFIGGSAYLSSFIVELLGTCLMITLTFSPGKWVGVDSTMIAWTAHAMGVVASDKISGGPHVNPAVSVAMWSLGKCSYSEAFVRIAGAMGGGLLAFPLLRFFTDTVGFIPLGGPEYSPEGDEDASLSSFSEFAATFLLLVIIFVLNWELNFGKYHYWIKQTLTALGIRFLIEAFPTAGPSINPMLATSWAVFASGFKDDAWATSGFFPEDIRFYYVYWIASVSGALLASLGYVVYAGGTFFGKSLPIGPIASKKSKKD